MKKIFFVIMCICSGGMVMAQAAPTNTLSIEESNRLNGVPAEPKINGIPYSQYKAQQDNLKKQQVQQQANNAANTPKGLTAITGSSSEKPAIVTPQKAVNVKGSSVEPIKPVDAKMPAKKEEAKKAAEPSSLNG
jgi:hypothetical protein